MHRTVWFRKCCDLHAFVSGGTFCYAYMVWSGLAGSIPKIEACIIETRYDSNDWQVFASHDVPSFGRKEQEMYIRCLIILWAS